MSKFFKRGQKVTVIPNLTRDMVIQAGLSDYYFYKLATTKRKTYTIKSDKVEGWIVRGDCWYLLYNDLVYKESWLIPADSFVDLDNAEITADKLKELLNE